MTEETSDPWPRRTQRLTLRWVTEADLPAVYAYRCLPDVTQWMPDRPRSYEEFALRAGRVGMLDRTLVIEAAEAGGAVVGDLYLKVGDGWAQSGATERAASTQAEIGWCVAPASQGRGYATEAVAEVIRVCFEDLGLRRLTAGAFADNAPSLAVMERMGMRLEARHVKESLHRDLGWVDSVVYALLAEEWLERRLRVSQWDRPTPSV